MKKKFIIFLVLLTAVLSVHTPLWSDVPAPPANQTVGVPDGIFNNIGESECRFCHEDPDIVTGETNIPNRHHNLVYSPVQSGKCAINNTVCFSDSDCDTAIAEECLGETVAPDKDADQNGVNDTVYQCLNCHLEDTTGGIIQLLVWRDCLLCHVQIPGEASVHHLTPIAQGIDSPLGDPGVGDCTPCHGTLVDDIGDGHFIPQYAPTLRTPARSGGLAYPLNSRGNGAGACDYCHDQDTAPPAAPVEIYTNEETHHGTGFGIDAEKCGWCHDFLLPFKNQMRVCEGCHGPDSLHAIQTDSDGDNTITPGIEIPFYGHIGEPDDCWGCHGFALSSSPGTGPMVPYISGTDTYVMPAGSDTTVTLTGSAFTNLSQGVLLTSSVNLTGADGSSAVLIPDTISESSLIFTISGATYPGTYRIRAVKGIEQSNPIIITVVPVVSITDVTCNRKKGVLTITGSGFGEKPAGTDDYINVQVNGLSVSVTSWSDTRITASVSGCGNNAVITVNALAGSATTGSGGGKPERPCNGKRC